MWRHPLIRDQAGLDARLRNVGSVAPPGDFRLDLAQSPARRRLKCIPFQKDCSATSVEEETTRKGRKSRALRGSNLRERRRRLKVMENISKFDNSNKDKHRCNIQYSTKKVSEGKFDSSMVAVVSLLLE